MLKFVALCALILCSQAAPTDKPTESDSTAADAFDVTEKSLSHDHAHQLARVKTYSTEKRDKREDDSLSSSTNENKRTPVLSQPDYQENKPPTFVRPVPVDQIIKNSHASPQIHSGKHVEQENEEDAEHTVEEDGKSTNGDEDVEQPKPKRVHHQHAHKSNSDDEHDSQ